MVKCPWCGNEIPTDEYSEHYKICSARRRVLPEVMPTKEELEKEEKEKRELEAIIWQAYKVHIEPYRVMGYFTGSVRQWIQFFDMITDAIIVGKHDAHYLLALISDFFKERIKERDIE